MEGTSFTIHHLDQNPISSRSTEFDKIAGIALLRVYFPRRLSLGVSFRIFCGAHDFLGFRFFTVGAKWTDFHPYSNCFHTRYRLLSVHYEENRRVCVHHSSRDLLLYGCDVMCVSLAHSRLF